MFITFEGIEGSGKSTQTKLLTQACEESSIKYICTREPGGTTQSERIRNILVSGEPDSLDKITELLLIMAARNEHIKNKIKPAIDENHLVICDRFIDSTIAYQSYGRNIESKIIENISHMLVCNLIPDLTFIFDMKVEDALLRTMHRNQAENRFEKMDIEFHYRTRQGFLEILKKNENRCVMIDANLDITMIHKIILDEIYNRLGIKLKHVDILSK